MTNKVYNIVESQLPQFIRDDSRYAVFLEFLKDYYIFIDRIDVSTLRDVDQTEYLEQLISEYAINFEPIRLLSEDKQRVVLKNLIDLYKSKGSYNSYASLFSILYNKEIEIFLPSTQIFRTSSASWNRDVSVRFIINEGLLSSFEDFDATIITNSGRILNLNILKVTRVKNTVNVFEAVIATKFKLTINSGSAIYGPGFTGTLVTTTTKKTIKTPGKGFIVGDIYEINNSGGIGTKIRVTRTDQNTGIAAFDIVQFGQGYTTSFTATITPQNIEQAPQAKNLSIQRFDEFGAPVEAQDFSSDDNINKMVDDINIVRFDYVNSVDYLLDNTYVGEILVSAQYETINSVDGEDLSASILFELGFVLEYPGYYSTNIGFTSDASFLQDGKYYQQFSYVIKTEKVFEDYESTVKDLLHPAGFRMFGDYTINRELNINVDVFNRLNLFEVSFIDLYNVEEIINKVYIKNIETEEVMVQDDINFTYIKDLLNEVIVSEPLFIKTLNKNLIEQITSQEELIKNLDKNIEDDVDLFELVQKEFSTEKTEEVTTDNPGCAFFGDGYYNFSEVITKGTYWECGYAEGEIVIN